MQKSSLFMKIFCRASLVLSICISLLLLSMSGISTCTMRADYHETTFFISKSMIPKIATCFIIVVTSFFFYLKWGKTVCSIIESDSIFRNNVIKKLTLFLFLVSALWVCFTRPTVISDQGEILKAAEQLNYKDYTCIKPGGYLARYPHQIGSVLTVSLILKVVGRDNYFVFQLMNAAMIAICYYLLSCLSAYMKFSNCVQTAVLLLGLLFFPFLFYSTFVYATVPSFLFSLIAFCLFAEFEISPKRTTAFFCAFSMSVGVFLKQNALIFTIALLIVSLIFTWQEKKLKYICLSILLVGLTALVLFLPKVLLEKKTGIHMVDGISPFSYLAMGVQDGERAPGWYNMYINIIYGQSGYAAEIQKEVALSDYMQRMAYFKSNPSDAFRFFLQKIASEWNNPTFEALWINQVRGTVAEPAKWVALIHKPQNVDIITDCLNIFQFFVWMFIVIDLLHGKQITLIYYLPLLTFIGGFVFHCIWEAKCQYTMPYFILLFPYAAHGFCLFFATIMKKAMGINMVKTQNNVYMMIVFFLFILISIVLQKSGYITCNNADYAEYLSGVH